VLQGSRKEPPALDPDKSPETGIVPGTDILIICEEWADRLLGSRSQQSWYSDWKIYIGTIIFCTVWSKWIFVGNQGRYHTKALHVFGFNLIILHLLQYNPKHGFTLMLLLIISQNLLAVVSGYREKVNMMKVFVADTIYSAPSESFLQVCLVFLGQLMFTGFYFYALWKGFKEMRTAGKSNYFFWFAAYIAVQLTLYFNRGKDSELGHVMDVRGCVYIWKNRRQLLFSYVERKGKPSEPFRLSAFYWTACCIMNFMVNMIIRDVIAFTVPVLLMSFHDPLNCIVYSIGFHFIATMDDCSDITYFLTWQEENKGLEDS